MTEQPLTPEQEAEVSQLARDFKHHFERVCVDADEMSSPLAELVPPVERPIGDGEFDVMFSLNVTEIVEALRGLPDGAGTAAFLAAFEARRRRAAPGR